MLCDGCETFLNKEYETPVSRIWHKLIPDTVDSAKILVPIADVATLKLFHLANFWRASVSQQWRFAKGKIDPWHQEQIRQMLVSRDPRGPGARRPDDGPPFEQRCEGNLHDPASRDARRDECRVPLDDLRRWALGCRLLSARFWWALPGSNRGPMD
jgi:hypothetical protein